MENVPSALLSDGENDIVFSALGPQRVSQATAVVEMLHALPPGGDQWVKFKTGVLCFVNDYSLQSYFIQLVDMSSEKVIFDQELYENFEYIRVRPYFFTFAGENFMVGLNFTCLDEASRFAYAVEQACKFRATMSINAPKSDYGLEVENSKPKKKAKRKKVKKARLV